MKDSRPHRIATLFGGVAVRLPRFLCAGCGHKEMGVNWPLHCRSTPELEQLQAHLSALMTYRVAAGVLTHLLPVEAGKSPETLRGHSRRTRTAPKFQGFVVLHVYIERADARPLADRDADQRPGKTLPKRGDLWLNPSTGPNLLPG